MVTLPTPYFSNERITLYHGDSRVIVPEILANTQVELVVTDPPYGMSYLSKRGEVDSKFDTIHGDHEYDTDMLKLLRGAARSAMYAFCRWDNIPEFVAAGLKPKSFISCVKNSWTMGDLEHEYGRQWEGCAFWPGPEHKWRNGRPADFIQYVRVGSKQMIHPTQKPEGLMEIIIKQSEGETILDPYAGSGSTLVAAKMLGLKCIGIEIDEHFCSVATERLKQAALLGDRFAIVKPIPMVQEALF